MASLYQKFKLLQGLLSGEFAYTGPFHVMVDVTRRCNLQCIGCRFHSPLVRRPSLGDQSVIDISPDLIKNLCHDLRTMNTRTLFLLGEGEPFLHPQIFDIISIAKEYGFITTVITNGTLLDSKRIQVLCDLKLDVLQVTLWASSSETYGQQYPGANPNNFQKVVNALEFLAIFKKKIRSKFPSVILHHPINRNNFQKIDAALELALSTNCDGISFSPFLSIEGSLKSYGLLPEEERCLFSTLINMKNRLKTSNLKHNIDRTLLRYKSSREKGWQIPCYAGWFHSRVRVDGSVMPCGPCNIVMGNLTKNCFSEVWYGLQYRNLRKQTFMSSNSALLEQECDCEYCCYAEDNVRIHHLFRWALPLLS